MLLVIDVQLVMLYVLAEIGVGNDDDDPGWESFLRLCQCIFAPSSSWPFGLSTDTGTSSGQVITWPLLPLGHS